MEPYRTQRTCDVPRYLPALIRQRNLRLEVLKEELRLKSMMLMIGIKRIMKMMKMMKKLRQVIGM